MNLLFCLLQVIYFRKKNPQKLPKYLSLLKFVGSDKYLNTFNFDGGYNKRAFKQLKINKVLYGRYTT